MSIEREGHDGPPHEPVPTPRKPKEGPHPSAPVDISEESVAGEEDPGASLDMDVTEPAPTEPAGGAADRSSGAPSGRAPRRVR